MPIPALAAGLIATAAAGATEYGVQSGLAKGNSKRALRQQKAYTDIAYGANTRMAEFNQKLQLEGLEKGYGAQMKGLKDAGLNPALMYGTSGGGGMTTQGAQGVGTGQEHGETAVRMNTGMAIQQGMELALMKAQKDNIEADTANKQAETHIKPIQEANITADTKNKGLTSEMQVIQNKIAGDTAENAIATVEIELQKRMQELEQQVRQNAISEETKQSTIDRAKAEAAGAVITNELMKQQTEQSKSTVQTNQASIAKMAADILQGWKKLNIDEQNAVTNKFMAGLKAAYPGVTQIPAAMMKEIMDRIGDKLSGGTRDAHNTVPNVLK